MTKQTRQTRNGNGQRNAAPSHIVYFVPERENAPWTRIGAMWPTPNGKGYRQVLDLTPVQPGGIVVLPNEPRQAQSEGGG